jgi:hypothetical protein
MFLPTLCLIARILQQFDGSPLAGTPFETLSAAFRQTPFAWIFSREKASREILCRHLALRVLRYTYKPN